MIDENRTRSVGVAHLKSFLRFAEQGPASLLATTTAPDHDQLESPFEEEVMRVLTAAGWTVHTQVGCSGYRIDLGVVDPARPGTYLLGIECDGATYHGSRTARERDRLREDVLITLGWRIHRIWSTDWWYDRAAQREKLLAAVEQAQKQALVPVRRTPPPAQAPEPLMSAGPTLEERLAAGPAVTWPAEASAWRTPTLGEISVVKEAFYDAKSGAVLRNQIRALITGFGPMHREAAWRVISTAWGFGSIGKRINAQLDACVPQDVIVRGDFLWAAGLDPATWRGFRYADPSAPRDVAEVADEELANIAAWVLDRAVAISEADLVREVARVLGGRSVTARMSTRVVAAIGPLVPTRATREGDRWRWVG